MNPLDTKYASLGSVNYFTHHIDTNANLNYAVKNLTPQLKLVFVCYMFREGIRGGNGCCDANTKDSASTFCLQN
jgi:hypothetical protein